jgi:hypothetical protein
MERWLSGLKRQIVNLLRFLIVGSNPTRSLKINLVITIRNMA